jgi:hypothetical protein
LPGDQTVTMIQRVVIDVDSGKMVRLHFPPISTIRCATTWPAAATGATCSGAPTDRPWRSFHRPRSSSGAAARRRRGHRIIRDVLEEKAETFYESGNGAAPGAIARVERSDLVLGARQLGPSLPGYDLKTGREKNLITTGNGNVTQLLRRREEPAAIVAVGREQGRDPYFGISIASAWTARTCAADAGGRRPRRDARRRGAFSSIPTEADAADLLCATRTAAGSGAREADVSSWPAGWQPPVLIR